MGTQYRMTSSKIQKSILASFEQYAAGICTVPIVDSLAPIGAALNRLSLADLLRGLRQPGITVSHRGSEVLCCVFRNFHTASADSPNHDTTRRAQPRWAVQQAASPMRPQPVSPCPATRSSGSEDSLLDRFHTRVASSGQRGQLARLLDGISGLPSAETTRRGAAFTMAESLTSLPGIGPPTLQCLPKRDLPC